MVDPLSFFLILASNSNGVTKACGGMCYPVCGMVHIEREREMFYLTTHSTHFIYGYMASDIW